MKKWTKIAYHSANVLLPLSETARMVRAGRHVAGRHAEQIRRLFPKRTAADVGELTFDEAVAASGLSRERLINRYLLNKRVWLGLFALAVLPVLMLPAALLLADIPAPGLLAVRTASLVFMLACFAGLLFARAMKSQLHLWQLQSGRLGSFADWRAERRWLRDVFRWSLPPSA